MPTFTEIAARRAAVNTPAKLGDFPMPVKAGRQSEPENAGTLGGLFSELSEIVPNFDIQILAAIEHLAKYHPELSFAVDNIVHLGNTKHNVYFADDVGDALQKRAMNHLKRKARDWYAFSGGLTSLTNDLLVQSAVTGAISAEAVPDNGLSGIRRVVLVNPKNIRFRYNSRTDEYDTYQRPTGQAVPADPLRGRKLNPVTYTYAAYRRFGEHPYAMPPFMAAIANIKIDAFIQDNLRFVVKKLGVLGFLEVLVNGPKIRPKESDVEYMGRTKAYLNSVIPEIEKGLSQGYVAGFKNVHEFKMHPTTSDVTGAKALIDLNDTKLMAGLKQDPMMAGKSFNTSETLGRVILAKMVKQVHSHQASIAAFYEKLFMLELRMAGMPIDFLEVEFTEPMVGDKLRDEQALMLRAKRLDNLYASGVISQQQKAIENGYEEPDQKEPRIPLVDNADLNTGGKTKSPTDSGKETDPSKG